MRSVSFCLAESEDREDILKRIKSVEGVSEVRQLRSESKSAYVRTLWFAFISMHVALSNALRAISEIQGVTNASIPAERELMSVEGADRDSKESAKHIRKLLSDIFEDETIDLWLATPNSCFNDRTPQELLDEGKSQAIIATLEFWSEGF